MAISLSSANTVSIDTAQLESMERRYKVNLVNSLSGFKSANLVGTRSVEGRANLAVFSSAFHLGADPAYLGLISRPDNGDRHTLDNIRETGVFTINHVNEEIYSQAHQTSARYPRDVSEFESVGLEEIQRDNFEAPFVKQAAIQIGLTLVDILPIKCNDTLMIIGEIRAVHLPESVLMADGYIDVEGAGTIAVSGLDSYHATNRIARLSYAKPNLAAKKIA